MTRAYDDIGALSGLFAPAYINGDPVAEAAAARWNAAHLRKRPDADRSAIYGAVKDGGAIGDGGPPSSRDLIARALLMQSSGEGGESGSMGFGESGMGHAESSAPSLGFSAPDAAPTSAPATSAPATSAPSVAAPADAPATAPAATTPATPASLSGLFGQEMGKADTVNDNIAAAIAANNNMTTIAQQYGYMENSPTSPAQKGDNLAATTTAPTAPTAPAPAPAVAAPSAPSGPSMGTGTVGAPGQGVGPGGGFGAPGFGGIANSTMGIGYGYGTLGSPSDENGNPSAIGAVPGVTATSMSDVGVNALGAPTAPGWGGFSGAQATTTSPGWGAPFGAVSEDEGTPANASPTEGNVADAPGFGFGFGGTEGNEGGLGGGEGASGVGGSGNEGGLGGGEGASGVGGGGPGSSGGNDGTGGVGTGNAGMGGSPGDSAGGGNDGGVGAGGASTGGNGGLGGEGGEGGNW